MTMIAEAAVSRTRTTERLFIIYVLTKQPSVKAARLQENNNNNNPQQAKQR